jgi:hypothetical protein
VADAWMPGARRIRAGIDGGQLGGGAPRVVWLTLGAGSSVVSVWSAAQLLNQEERPCHLVWDPLTGDIAQLLPIVRSGCALGAPEHLDWAPDRLPYRRSTVNAEGRLCVQIAVLGSCAEPFTGYPMIGLGDILIWLDSWQIPRWWPAGPPPPFRQAHARARSRALWAKGGHFGASQVPDCDYIGPGGIDVGQFLTAYPMPPELPEPQPTAAAAIRFGSRAEREIPAAASLTAAGVLWSRPRPGWIPCRGGCPRTVRDREHA